MPRKALENLDRLVSTGALKAEPPNDAEFAGLVASAAARLRDAERAENSLESRFDLAYNAAHAFSLAALRWHGDRPDNRRYIVFQALTHALDLPNPQWRCSTMRTAGETRSNTRGSSSSRPNCWTPFSA